MSSLLRRIVCSLAIAERQILGSHRGGAASLPIPDISHAWCHRCGATIPASDRVQDFESIATACRQCQGGRRARDRTTRLGVYDDQWREAILAVKHGRDRALARKLGTLLAVQWLRDSERSTGLLLDAIVVPVPMPFARRVERGINHASEIATAVSKRLGCPLLRCLEHAPGPTQAQLTRESRRSRPKRIHLRERGMPDLSSARLVFLVDDVLTTGSTADQSCNALRGAMGWVRIEMLVVAVTELSKTAMNQAKKCQFRTD